MNLYSLEHACTEDYLIRDLQGIGGSTRDIAECLLSQKVFTQRVVDQWNRLHQNVTNADRMVFSKAALDMYWYELRHGHKKGQ